MFAISVLLRFAPFVDTTARNYASSKTVSRARMDGSVSPAIDNEASSGQSARNGETRGERVGTRVFVCRPSFYVPGGLRPPPGRNDR
jgi:hypothetical protein